MRNSREAIVAAWMERVEELPSAAGKSYGVLRDHVPEIVDHLADVLEQDRASGDAALDRLAGAHAVLRHREGYDLRQIVLEYQMLRQTILTMYNSTNPPLTSTLVPIAHLDRSLDEAIGDAVDRFMDERDKARDVFVGILGHDLRTPLQSIAVATDTILQRGAADPAIVKAAGVTGKAVARMSRMIGDLLDFARGRLGGGISLDAAPVDDLRLVVRAAIEEQAAANPEKAIQDLSHDAPGDFAGTWDVARIAQALANLIGNAIQHGDDAPVVVSTADDGTTVRIEVTNGGTIPDEVRATLFQPFRRAGRGDGLGLGLYVVDEIARAHGGNVEVESDAARGTRFTLVLPREPKLTSRPRRDPSFAAAS
ncbi:MAG TPA: sensor histidine kinase [Kofleriaceae bacterium]|nr:sensor histidine kinase [Kofleriaceae bacterium]